MTETERLDIIKKIKEKINKNKILEEKNKELERLLQEESVRKYLKLQDEINTLKQEQKYFTEKEEKIVELEFSYGIRKLSSCNHDIWMYAGSCSIECDSSDGINPREVKYNTEKCSNFEYNKYVCLECGKEIKIHDWEEFENSNFVLKANIKNINEYRNLYYYLLFNNQVDKAQEILKEEFYKDIRIANSFPCKKRVYKNT